MELGWQGERDAKTSGPHHLAPVKMSGAALEIHTRIMPRMWSLPESEMLRSTRSIPGFASLETLSPEGMILHALVHCTTHLFDGGLKAAWDVEWIRERYSEIDWNLIGDWADESALPMAFYLPARVLRTTLAIPIPSALLERGAYTPRFDALARLVRGRMFATFHDPQEINPFTKNGVFFVMQTKWRSRLMHVVSLLDRDSAEARGTGYATMSARHGRGVPQMLAQQLQESIQQAALFRTFRTRAIAEACEIELFRHD